MDKNLIKAFIRWLEQASEEEIMAHRDYILSKEAVITTREGKAEIRLALRLIDEELLSTMRSRILG